MLISLIVLLPLVLLVSFVGVKAAEGCFAVAVGKDASATGRVIIAHNEDNCGELVMRHHYIKARSINDCFGEFSFEKGSAPMKLPDKTYGFFWTETLRAEPGESFGDSFVNECGVAVVSNNCRESRASVGDDSELLSDGGIGWGLRFMVAAGSESARSAVDIAAQLVEKYGYMASGRSYIFADPDEAWVFQIIRGKCYAAKRLPDDEVTVCPNHYTIRNIPLQGDKNNIVSPKLPLYAAAQALSEDSRVCGLDFARVFQHPDYVMTEMNKHRHRYGLAAFTGQSFQDKDDLPFSVVPKEKVTAAKLREVLSCHCGASAEEAHRTGDCMEMTDETRNHFTSVCNGATMESMIVDLRSERRDSVVWSCFGNPCVVPMTPWRLGAECMPCLFSGYDRESEVSLGELTWLHFHATADDLKTCAPEAWTSSRK